MDQWPAADLAQGFVDAQLDALQCLHAAKAEMAIVGAAVARQLAAGSGRLVYCGAGSAGAQACVDGLELPATFGWPRERLSLLLAGGLESFYDLGGASEDDRALADSDVQALQLTSADVLIAVSASGSTPYTHQAVLHAQATGAMTVALVNNDESPLQAAADYSVLLQSGAEAIAGSTRLAAGSAQKIALNTLSSMIMAQLGYVHDNLMVRMQVSNQKLQARAAAMVSQIVGCDNAAANRALQQAGLDVPTAVLVAQGDSLTAAQAKLKRHGGRLRDALNDE